MLLPFIFQVSTIRNNLLTVSNSLVAIQKIILYSGYKEKTYSEPVLQFLEFQRDILRCTYYALKMFYEAFSTAISDRAVLSEIPKSINCYVSNRLLKEYANSSASYSFDDSFLKLDQVMVY